MDKPDLRARMRQVGPLQPGVGAAVVDSLFRWLSPRLPGTISAFLAMEGEVDLEPLFQRLPGWRWVLPRVAPDRQLTFRDAALPRETHSFGMRQPIDSGQVVPIPEIDVFLVPGLAFDLEGGRLGNGAGHYDRVLAQARHDALAVGIAPQARLVDRVPREPHDVAMDHLATESEVIDCLPPTR